MNPKAWLEMVAAECFSKLDVVGKPLKWNRADIWETGSDGWCVKCQVPGYSEISIQFWYDRYTSFGDGPLRLYAGIEFHQRSIFDAFYAAKEHDFDVVNSENIDVSKEISFIDEDKMLELGLFPPFFERYIPERQWFFGRYYSEENPHVSNPSISGYVKKPSKFLGRHIEEIMELIDNKGSLEKIHYDIGLRGQRVVDEHLRKRLLEKFEHTCQGCGYKLSVSNKWIMEVHHQKPLRDGERITKPEGLLVLCPNCHTVAHSRSQKPLNLAEIRHAVRNIRRAMLRSGH